MEVAVVGDLIGTLGFPVVVCIALFWSNRETVKHYEKVLFEFKRTLDANTDALTRLLERVK